MPLSLSRDTAIQGHAQGGRFTILESWLVPSSWRKTWKHSMSTTWSKEFKCLNFKIAVFFADECLTQLFFTSLITTGFSEAVLRTNSYVKPKQFCCTLFKFCDTHYSEAVDAELLNSEPFVKTSCKSRAICEPGGSPAVRLQQSTMYILSWFSLSLPYLFLRYTHTPFSK